jgi:hypothetical protein
MLTVDGPSGCGNIHLSLVMHRYKAHWQKMTILYGVDSTEISARFLVHVFVHHEE